MQLDTSDEQSVLSAADKLASIPIDVVINNAGIAERGDLNMTTKAELMRLFEINVTGPFLTTRALLPNLKLAAKANGVAFVAQVTSWLGSIKDNSPESEASKVLPPGGRYGYRASKAALNMVNKSLSVDLKDDKIGCVLLHPGYVATDMNNYAPGAINVEESVAGMTKVISGFTLADSGKFLDYEGTVLPW